MISFLALALAAAAPVDERAVGSSVSYVFATELGSGVYDIAGRTLQVYRLPLAYVWREASEREPGVRLVAPATFGFFDFEPGDLISSGLPSRVDSFSITPGVELQYELARGWQLFPYARFGASFASSDVDAMLYASGVRADYTRSLTPWDWLVRTELSYAGVDFRADVPDDDYVRFRNASELRRGIGRYVRGRELECGLYAILDAITDPPRVLVEGGVTEPLQFESGIMLGVRPAWRVRRVPLPRIGIGYRFAGELSGFRFVIGSPF
jgi:hypothetical protein